MLFALGMASLIGFSQLCIETVRRGRYRALFRDVHYIAMALNFPWFVAIYVVILFAMIKIPIIATLGGYLLWGHPVGFTLFLLAPIPLCAILMLVFALQMDRRWHRSRPASRWPRRIAPVYVAAVVVLILTPVYLSYLASVLYGVKPELAYRIDCFEQNRALYATVAVENSTAETKFLSGIEIGESDKKIVIDQPLLFDGLKEDVVVPPKGIRRIRLKVVSETAQFSDGATGAVCDVAQRLTDDDPQLTDAKVEILH
jgi:hypothetical protein